MRITINLLILTFLLSGCTSSKLKKYSNHKIETFCQDLNVLQTKIALISSNIANINITRTKEGGFYKRKFASNCTNGFCKVIKSSDDSPIMKYEPKHPDANSKGYVEYPGYSLESQIYDQKRWARAFEDVIEGFGVKEMNSFFLNDPRAKKCLDRYPAVRESFSFKNYLGR